MRRFQFVWWGWSVWRLPGFRRLPADHGLFPIYRWFFWIGPLDIRRWTDWAIEQHRVRALAGKEPMS